MWPPTETMIERAVLPDEVYANEGGVYGDEDGGEVIEGKVVRGDEEEGEKKDWRRPEGELRVM